MPSRVDYLGQFRLVSDAAEVRQAGDWMVTAMNGSSQVGGGMVPDAFAGFGRIFHPPFAVEATGGLPSREVTWREVAEANGRVSHPAMEWTAITGSYELSWGGAQDGIWDQVPGRGSLPQRVARVVCEILIDFTTTPGRCWCAVWEGHADLIGLRSDHSRPRLELPHRSMLLAAGPVSAVPETSFNDPVSPASPEADLLRGLHGYRSPSLWWPDDRAWCVASDVDMQTTYVGASAGCIDRLAGDGRIEAMRVTAGQSVMIDVDTVNPPPAGDPARA